MKNCISKKTRDIAFFAFNANIMDFKMWKKKDINLSLFMDALIKEREKAMEEIDEIQIC